ncbi:hypothetical protein B0H17DRAFT_1130472 [Mycena rosella]|uniref:C2 domain-containing protein n=1 Tax=Mycena rosella TaxID=1033263 RepID=A0AAD7DSM7_MYCRO|nr:hypothetical protein B0H17DRAFT_1130472 [Mycena rosella]
MSSSYSLLVQSVTGISWKPGPAHGKKPNLYVAIYQDGVEIKRTHTIKREIAPKWDYLANIPDPASSPISLRVFHDSSFPLVPDKHLATLNTSIPALLDQRGSEGDTKVLRLDLIGADGDQKGRPFGTISVRLMKVAEVAAVAIDKVQKAIEGVKLSGTESTLMKIGGILEHSKSTVEDLVSSLRSMTSKLSIIVAIGDELTTIHPYAHIAWKVLTAVYQTVKKQQETDDKLLELVDTMVDVYSFVGDVDFLADKIKGVEDKALAIVKQTVEYRAVRSTWLRADEKIYDLAQTLIKLKDSFEGRLAVQSLFLSAKMLKGVEALEQSDAWKKLNPLAMNAGLRPMCLPGTRRKILDDVTEWVTVPSEAGNILWLSGVAGSGKSTISTTVSESLRELDRLGAFLFFDRTDPSQSDPGAVIRTIAYCLALSNHRIGSVIAAVIHRDSAVINAPIRAQFKTLLLEPLEAVQQHIQGPILIILDALDECGDSDSRAPLLALLCDEFPKLPRFFRLLITSRRQADIIGQFQSRFKEIHLDTEVPSSTEDVELFLRHEMSHIQQQKKLGPEWPGEDNLLTLVQLSGGLFIWASTATKFMNGYRPDERLKILVTQNNAKRFNLDDLYSVALRNSGPWDTDTTFAQDAHAVLACVVLGKVPMTDQTIDMLLYSGTQRSQDVLSYLGCVLEWTPGQEARVLHISFADYLTDPNRSGSYPELRFNICNLEDSHLGNTTAPGLSERVKSMVSPQLSYSCCFGFNHIQETPFDLLVLGSIHSLLLHQFLYWLEVLSILGEMQSATTGLEVAAEYAKNGEDIELQNFITDASIFVAAFASIIAASAPHIYLSALPFSPVRSEIAQRFVPDTIKRKLA